MTKSSDEQFRARVRWGCRRGMLELDVILLRFFDARFDQLEAADKLEFERLLLEADPDLYSWLMGYATPLDPHFQRLVKRIREDYSAFAG